MVFLQCSTVLLGLAITLVKAQSNIGAIGLGYPLETTFSAANQNPLNKTRVAFTGFDFSADPATAGNVSKGQWTWNAGLSIINTNTNQTSYAISSAANSTSNVLDVAFTLDFPEGQLPNKSETNWTMCSFYLDISWTDSVLNRASGDPGDCSVVLGSSCLAKLRQGFSGPSNNASKCPSTPNFANLPECNSVSTNGYGYGYGAVSALYSDLSRNSTLVGLRSGEIFTYVYSKPFNQSEAVRNYNQFASQLRMNVLTFTPSAEYRLNTTSDRGGEVRTFCTILNKNAPRTNSGIKLRSSNAVAYAAVLTILLLFR